MNKLIFLSSIGFLDSDEKKYQLNNYLKNNVEVQLWNLNKIFKRDYYDPKIKILNNKKIKIINIKNFEDFEYYLNLDHSSSLFLVRYGFNYKYKKIFQLLSKNKIHYLFIDNGFIFKNNPLFFQSIKYFFIKLYNLKFLDIINSILNKIFFLLNISFFSIIGPKYIYCIFKSKFILQKNPLYSDSTRIIQGHHICYDNFLLYKKSTKKIKKKTAIFIDQGSPFHPDLKEKNSHSLDPEKYYDSINTFLLKISKTYQYKIEIACHPKVPISIIQKYFKNFVIRSNQTIDQISSGSLVIGHDSMALNYAVLFYKPLLFVTNNILDDDSYNHRKNMDLFASLLRKEVYNIDNFDFSNLQKKIKFKIRDYKYYIKKYINPWNNKITQSDIIINQLKKDSIWI